jgi:hypothetical protein
MEQTLVKKKEKKNGKLKTKQIINTQHKSNQTTQIKSSEIKNNVTRTAFCDRREIWHIYTSFLQSNNSLSLLVAEENFFYFIKSETRLSHGDHVFCPIGMKCANRIEDLQ